MKRYEKLITVDVVPHNEQRYDTCGDWEFAGKTLKVKVSRTDVTYMIPLAIHEIVEAYLCAAHGVSSKTVDKWDMAHPDHPDPGAIPGCPYFREHMTATMIERVIASELDLNWLKYEETLEKL